MVKIVEFFNGNIDDSLPFDVVDDVAIFMRNDPMFYRKKFYPTIVKLKNMHTKNEEINKSKIFDSMIQDATNMYCKKFKINKRPEELLSDEEQEKLIDKLFSEEMTNIRKGVY